jgi:predicted CxxxxCH...CXXCH cytochrome family protein
MRALRIAAVGLLLVGCEIPRERPAGDGYHPAGWAQKDSPRFHGTVLRATGDKLGDCQACHGADYKGGAVGVGCTASGCHTRGVEDCGTCHGGPAGPRPATGAHERHGRFCAECHHVPGAVQGHIDGVAEVVFAGLATAGGKSPSWDPAAQTCSQTYCHVDASPVWKKPEDTTTPCDACHGEPPASHARWSFVATPSGCGSCHPVPPDPAHIDGKLDVDPAMRCDACHGKGPLGAPPPALDGSTSPSARGVGAHRRHLDETLDDRMGRVVPCAACHSVPASIGAAGHLDTSAPADVALAGGGSYDAATLTCVVGCHWDRNPGPVWTDATGAARACDSCHGFPPAFTRKGTPHTPVQPSLAACLACHPFAPATHVDGHVDIGP